MSSNIIKTLIPHSCPHCQKEFIIEFQSMAPELSSVLRPEDVQAAKKDAIERIKTLSIDPEKLQETIAWVQDEDTIFGPNEVDSIINSLLRPEIEGD